MSGPVPPIAPVRTRGAFASHEGPHFVEDEQRVAYVEDAGVAFAFVVRGTGAQRSGRPIADVVAEACLRVFRDRTTATLDDLTETWWHAEHAGRAGLHPFASLPHADRAELRERVQKLLAERRPDAIGDQAVFDAEVSSLLELPALALRRGREELELARMRRDVHRGEGAAAACALFAGAQIAISHIGDCRVVRLRGGRLESLTLEHTLGNVYADSMPDITPEQLELLPKNVLVRILGGDGGDEMHKVDVVRDRLEPNDFYLLMTRGLAESFEDDDIRETLLARGIEAAPRLVERGRENFADHTLDNVAAVAVEILG